MPLSVQVVDQHLHFGTSMPLRVGAFIPLLTDRQTPLVSWGPAPATMCRRWAPTTTRRRPGPPTTRAGGYATTARLRSGARIVPTAIDAQVRRRLAFRGGAERRGRRAPAGTACCLHSGVSRALLVVFVISVRG